jgi:hypothetical protein
MYKVELEGWETITDIDQKKRGMFIALSLLAEDDERNNTGIRNYNGPVTPVHIVNPFSFGSCNY